MKRCLYLAVLLMVMAGAPLWAGSNLAVRVYQGYGNTLQMLVTMNDLPLDLATATRVDLPLKDRVISSANQSSDPIRWNQADYQAGELRLTLGTLSPPLSPGSYKAWLVIYNPQYPAGLVCDTQLQLEIVSGP